MYPNYKTDKDEKEFINHFTAACVSAEKRHLFKPEYRTRDAIFYLVEEPEWFKGDWIELETIVEDDLGDEFWIKFSNFVDDLQEPMLYMEDARLHTERRHELNLAKELRDTHLPFLQKKSLGQLCAIVRLARTKGLLQRIKKGDNLIYRQV
jgi:hypothetical protein